MPAPGRTHKGIRLGLLYLALILAAAFFAFPTIWLISSSFKLPVDMLQIRLLPAEPTLQHYHDIFVRGDFAHYLANSLLVTAGTVILTVLIALPAAFGFARFRFRFDVIFLMAFLVIRMVPTISLIIPYFVIFQRLGLIDTTLGLILANASLRLPFLVWVLTVFCREIPRDLEDAARVDGCTRTQVLLRIVLPLAAPGLAAGCVFTFIGAWNEFLLALPLSRTIASKTLPVAVAENIAGYEVMWGPLMASGVIYVIPVLLFTVFAQKWIVKGLAAGAVKG